MLSENFASPEIGLVSLFLVKSKFGERCDGNIPGCSKYLFVELAINSYIYSPLSLISSGTFQALRA